MRRPRPKRKPQQKIEAVGQQALVELKSSAADLAVEIAGKVVEEGRPGRRRSGRGDARMIFAAVNAGWPFDLEIQALVVFGIIVTVLVVFVGTLSRSRFSPPPTPDHREFEAGPAASEELKRAKGRTSKG
ncbi:MAG: hypothetical protein U1D30_04965 [Planctomycetota bacterium]